MTREIPGSIRRRDFVNGLLVGAGGAIGAQLLSGCPRQAVPLGLCDGSIALDPRAQRGGNLPKTFNVAHWLRDGRLTWSANAVTVAPLSCDDVSGSLPIGNDDGTYDVILVGSGLSGLSAAFHLIRARPGTRLLILDGSPSFGGNAGRDDGTPPLAVVSGTGGAYAVTPYEGFLTEIYSTIGIDWTKQQIAAPFYSYFFDDRTPHVQPGKFGWNVDTYGAGLKDVPYPPEVVVDLLASRDDFKQWGATPGAPTDPADHADPKFDDLAGITLDAYLRDRKGYHPAVSDFYSRYALSALGGTASQVNAFNSISFLGAEFGTLFAFPGGTSGIARHLVKWLIPGAIPGSTSEETIQNAVIATELDRAGHPVRLRQDAVALAVDTTSAGASVVYYKEGRFLRARAKALILAGLGHTTRHLIDHLVGAEARAAFGKIVQAPALVANVALKRAAPLVSLGLGYDMYWWGSKYWADFVVSDWISPARTDPERPTVLTFFGGNTVPSGDMAGERIQLLRTPFSDYEVSLREDMGRIFAGTGFDFERDVSAVYVYRWGHGMLLPGPGIPFGPPRVVNGTAVRTPAPRHLMRAQLGRISIAGQDTESSPSVESALASGRRAAHEVLPFL